MKTLLATTRQLPGEGMSSDYTLDDLVRLTGVPASRIGDWTRKGYLPAPSRPSASQRGRSPYHFPADTPSVVRALERWRGFAQDADIPLWLWLEGHDHVGLSPERLDQELEATVRDEWRELQQKLPSLPDLGSGPVTEQVRERLFDEIDERYTADFLQRGPEFGQVMAAVILSMCGLTSAEDIADWHASGLRDVEFGDTRSVGYLQATFNCLRQGFDTFALPELIVPGAVDVAVAQLCLPLLSLHRAVDRRQNWTIARTMWQELCRVTDEWLAEPRRAPDPILAYLAAWRRLCYRQRPGLVLFVLSSIASWAESAQLNVPSERS